MHFITDSVEYSVGEFYHRFSTKLPQMVQVTQGYCGEVTQEVFDRDQVIRLHTVSRQKRELANTTLQGETKPLGIPLSHEHVTVCVLLNKTTVGEVPEGRNCSLNKLQLRPSGITPTQCIPFSNQVIRLHTVSRQKRVVAKTTVQGETKLLGIPLSYEHVKLCVVSSKGHVGNEQYLADILRPKVKLPLIVQFPRDHVLPFGSRTLATNHIASLELLKIYDEISMLGNFIFGQTLSTEVTSLPLYLEQMRVSVVTGISGGPPGLTWQTYNKVLERNDVKLDYKQEYGNPEITEYHDLKDAESDSDDGLYEDVVPAQPNSLGNQPHHNTKVQTMATTTRPPQMCNPSTGPGGRSASTTAPASSIAHPSQKATAKDGVDAAYINMRMGSSGNTNVKMGPNVNTYETMGTSVNTNARMGPSVNAKTNTNDGYTNMRFGQNTSNSAPTNMAPVHALRSSEQISNNTDGVKCDTQSDASKIRSANNTSHGSQVERQPRKPLPAPPATAAKPTGTRFQQRAPNSQSLSEQSSNPQSTQTTAHTTSNRTTHSSANIDPGLQQTRRRQVTEKETPPALPPRPQGNSKPLISSTQRQRKYENVLPRSHVPPIVRPPVEGSPSVPKSAPTASIAQSTQRSMTQSLNVHENKDIDATKPNNDKPTNEQQRQTPFSYVSAPDLAARIDRSSETNGKTKHMPKQDNSNTDTAATTHKPQIKTDGMFGTQVVRKANSNEKGDKQSISHYTADNGNTKGDTASEPTVPNPKKIVESVESKSPTSPTTRISRSTVTANDISKFHIEDVSEHLKLLGLGKYVDEFKEQMVDGSLLEVLDKDILMNDFGMKTIEAIRLVKFIQTAHIPK